MDAVGRGKRGEREEESVSKHDILPECGRRMDGLARDGPDEPVSQDQIILRCERTGTGKFR